MSTSGASSVSLIERLYSYEMKRARNANVEAKLAKLNYQRTNIDWSSIDSQNSQSLGLNSAFNAMKFKWKDHIEEQYRLKTHTTIAGGNYSFFYMLPQVMAVLQNKYPNRNLKLALLEPENAKDFAKYDPDVLLSAHFGNSPRNFLGKVGKSHVVYRKMMNDEVFFYASADKVKSFGSKEQVLQNDKLLYARLYVDDRISERVLDYQFSVTPKNRKKNSPRIVMDQHYVTHHLMEHGLGIWIDCSSSKERSYINKISDSLSQIKRYCFFSKNNDQNLNYHIGRSVFEIVKRMEKEGKKHDEEN